MQWKFRAWLSLHKRPNSPQIPANLNSYPKRGALGLRSSKNWRWLLTLLLLLLLAALIIMGWQNNRDGDGNGKAAVPAASPSAVTAVPNAAYEGWRWVIPGGPAPDG